MSSDFFPPLGNIKPRAFISSRRIVNRIAFALGCYIFFVLYPAYGLLRIYWTGDTGSFAYSGILTALVTSTLFGLFARRTIARYLDVGATSD